MAPKSLFFVGLWFLSACVTVQAPESADLAPDASAASPGDDGVAPAAANDDAHRDAGIAPAAPGGPSDPLAAAEPPYDLVSPEDPSVPVAPTEPPAAAAEAPPGESCPAGMALVDGEYCPVVRHACKHWLEDPEKVPYARCGEYEPSSECLVPREHRRFCVDVEEYKKPGERLPAVHVSWTTAKKICESDGKRLCLESEWQFACEGEELRPYPYGYVRDASVCNFDRDQLYLPDGGLRDMRASADEFPACVSPFGVHDMVGNVDEWTVHDDGDGHPVTYPHRSALRGGWWMAARNRCRAATTAHDEIYEGAQTGFRCCADARD
jgi:sulfatase modifying factor 1